MKNCIKKAIITWLFKEDLEDEAYDIYSYGIYQIVSYVINFFTILLIGIAFRRLLEVIILVVFFMAVRPYAGGYHASSAIKCYILTNIMIIGALLAIKYIQINNIFMICLLALNSIVIFVLAPVDTANKKLDEIEYIVYRKKTVKILSVEIIISIIMIAMNCHIVAECIIFAHIILSFALIAGIASNLGIKNE